MRRLQQLYVFWACWVIMLAFDPIPGYCRYYTLREHGSEHRRGDWQRHWSWQRRGLWGTRLVNRLGFMGTFCDECERRARARKPSSGS